MGVEGIVIYVVTGVLLIVSFLKDRKKTLKGLKKGYKSFMKLLPVLLPIFLFIGILVT